MKSPMTKLPQNGERPCTYQMRKEQQVELVVLTGGPGAGKTAVLELLRKVLCEHFAMLPEAAAIVFDGGFWQMDSISGRMAAQKAIYHVQEEMQQLVLNEKKWTMGLCDRGTLDCFAYWPGNETEFLASLDTTLQIELQKYKAVIHLRIPELGSTAEARLLDERIYEIWNRHPNYCMIEPTENFIDKANEAIRKIESFTPSCCREHLDQFSEQIGGGLKLKVL